MQILNVSSEPVQAAAQFNFQGWVISFSTIFKGCSVIAWNNQNGDEINAESVEEVINQILIRGLFSKDKTTFVGRI